MELELEEEAFLYDEKRFTDIAQKLKDAGFSLSADNFGRGYSSINYIKTVPINELKLDRMFVNSLKKNYFRIVKR